MAAVDPGAFSPQALPPHPATPVYYTSSAAGWRLIIDLALGVTVSLGLCLIAARLPRPWAVILILSFVWIAPNLPARADFLLNAALFCWGCLCFPKPGTRWISQRRCLRPIAGTRLVERPRLPPAPGIPKLRRLQRSPERTQ